ncbi:MAG: alpha/beta hydrolase [Sedimenticola sp.]|nr:alpha/beta hydrolase [Sedimenticola sp.]
MSPQNSPPEPGVPLLLLHSSMSSKAQWSRLEQALPAGYRVIALDLYGYGDAPFPDDPEHFSLEQEAVRIGQLAEQLIGAQPFHLIGHSYGAATALRYAYDNPDRLLSIGLFEPVAFHLLPEQDAAIKQMQSVGAAVTMALAAGDAATATRHFIDFWSGSGTYARMDRDRQLLMDRYIHKVALDFQALFNEPLSAADYQRIDTPTCLLWSPQSPPPTRRVAALLGETLPWIESHSVPGGHLAPLTNPDQVNPHWIRFLRQQEA